MTRAETGVDVLGSLVAGCTANANTECHAALQYRTVDARSLWQQGRHGVHRLCATPSVRGTMYPKIKL